MSRRRGGLWATVGLMLCFCISPLFAGATPLVTEQSQAETFLAKAEAWLGAWLSVLQRIVVKEGEVGVGGEAGAASSHQDVDSSGAHTDEGSTINPDG